MPTLNKILFVQLLLILVTAGGGTAWSAKNAGPAKPSCPHTLKALATSLSRQDTRLEAAAKKLQAKDFKSVNLDHPSLQARIELFVPYALPGKLPFREVHQECWINYADFKKALEKGDRAQAASKIKGWKDCLETVYRKVPLPTRKVLSCFSKIK